MNSNRSENSYSIDFNEVKQSVNVSKKKISFISAILIVIGSCIGSGIFLKSSSILSNTWYSLPLSITTWVVSAIAVIAMSLALIEITSVKSNNLGMIGWVKNFNKKIVYKACKNFMFFIYTPLSFFFMPLYVLNSFQDALSAFGVSNNFGTSVDFLIWSFIAILISAWFIFSSGLNAKTGNIQNWVITSIKFFPIVIIIVLGFYIAIVNNIGNDIVVTPDNSQKDPTSFAGISPVVGMFISFGAIFFAYDGFYFSNGVMTEMETPKKASFALIIGLSITTIIYLLIAIAMTFSNPKSGSLNDFSKFLQTKNASWVFGIVNLMVSIGICGIINGLSMWATRFAEDLIKSGELVLFYKYSNKLNPHRPIVGSIYTAIIALIMFVIFALIGGLAYAPGGYVDGYDASGYNSMAKLLNFADLMGNWTSILVFAFIVAAIFSCLMNRKTNRIKVVKYKYFVPVAITSIIIVGFGTAIQFASPFIDVIMMAVPSIRAQLTQEDIIGRIMLIVVFIVFIIAMIVPSVFDYDSKFLQAKFKFNVFKNEDGLDQVDLIS